jgi:3-dehydroquinate dehydratase-2
VRVTVLNGVNLGMLGAREPEVYGTLTHAELTQRIQAWAGERGQRADVRQTDCEGEYVRAIHAACGEADAVIVNPGAWTHYSWAIRDALAILPVPVVEVHLSEPLEREPWRHHSVVSEVASARFAGMGADGYRAALDWLQERAA